MALFKSTPLLKNEFVLKYYNASIITMTRNE